MDDQPQDEGMGWEAQQNLEARRQQDDQVELGYHSWLDEMEMVARDERAEYGHDGMDAVLGAEDLRQWNLQQRINAMGGF